MKMAITITIDRECADYLDMKAGKVSHIINELILSDMQQALQMKKTVWVLCKVCKERKKEDQECAYCIIDAAQTRLGGI
jgi:hypothetical protein